MSCIDSSVDLVVYGISTPKTLTSSFLHSLPIFFECLLDDLIVECLPPPTAISRSLSTANIDDRASFFDVLAPPPSPFVSSSAVVETAPGGPRPFPPLACDRESFAG